LKSTARKQMASGKQISGIAPQARGIDSIVPVFGYSSESKCRSAALELAKEHIDRITTLKATILR
jgi:hypothetical protein